MKKTGTLNTLELMSKEEGKHMDSPDSVKVLLCRRRARVPLLIVRSCNDQSSVVLPHFGVTTRTHRSLHR